MDKITVIVNGPESIDPNSPIGAELAGFSSAVLYNFTAIIIRLLEAGEYVGAASILNTAIRTKCEINGVLWGPNKPPSQNENESADDDKLNDA